jgi:hypothetical protein
MALHFAARIHALTGFDADSTSDTDTGQDFDEHAAQWMTEAIREVIDLLPQHLVERCGKVTSAAVEYTNGTGVETENKVMSVQRALGTGFAIGQVFICRQIPHTMAHKAADPDSLEHATSTDPVWYYDHASGGDNSVLLKVLPTSSSEVAKVTTVDYPLFTAGDTETYDVSSKTVITNFPDEAEHLVVLRAAITAAEYMLMEEEDPEIYLPMIQNLKQDYNQGLQALGVQMAQPQQGGR